MNTIQFPTWDNNVKQLFSQPYWIEQDRRDKVAAEWQGCMSGFGITLDDYKSVRESAVTIYHHLYSQSMPLTRDTTQYWPYDALELLRVWINEGCRLDSNQPIHEEPIIPPPELKPIKLRVRKNILDLTEDELNEYRMKLETLDISKVDSNATWQRLAYLHTTWCLHYQEAFLLWHRAYLLYFENLIDFPIPYWNWMSPNATQDGHPESGLPQAFKDLTYIHPQTGEERPNPLRFAIAKDGKSKKCQTQTGDCLNEEECKYVQRDPILYTTGDDRRKEREEKLALVGKYQRQVANALLWDIFSTPQGNPGYPWANILSFDPPPPDCAYPNKCDFDGLFEQPHDNMHGWVGPDMADNAYTAYDPVFWSYHSNVDRIFENWNRAHPGAIFTSNFPLRPLIGSLAQEIDLVETRSYLYTTIGDMAKNSQSLGYDYEVPSVPDSSGTFYDQWSDYLYIIFNNVKCTYDTYSIDIFLNQSNPQPKDAKCDNLNFVGKIMRLGMGIEDNKGRCIKDGVTRVIDASYNSYYLKLTPTSEITISLIVTNQTTGEILTPQEYAKLPGFVPTCNWGKKISTVVPESSSGNCHCD
ncbi:tyrosinase family protein [Nostoc calcicola FACHB-3891]|nr:tyrosinase family protein [Nostoc calcicola FACHB-3891]